VDRHRANTSSYVTYVSKYDLLCRLKMYIICIYLRAHIVGLGGRIIGLKPNSEMEKSCEEMARVPDWDINCNFLDVPRKILKGLSLNDQFPS